MADFDPFDALRDASRNAVVPEAAAIRARGRQRQARQRMAYAAAAVVVVVGGVSAGVAVAGSGSSVSVRNPATQAPTVVVSDEPTPTETPSVEPTTTPSPTGAPAPTDVNLSSVDFGSVTLPAGICGLTEPVTLKSGTVTSSAGRSTPVRLAWQDPAGSKQVYRASVDGTSDAFMPVLCNTLGTGGTSEGGVLVGFSGKGGLHTLGVLAPRSQTGSYTAFPKQPSVSGGVLTMPEVYGGPGDPDCCSPGNAYSVWEFDGTKMALLADKSGINIRVVVTVTASSAHSITYKVRLEGHSYQFVQMDNNNAPATSKEQIYSISTLLNGSPIYQGDGGAIGCAPGTPLVPNTFSWDNTQTADGNTGKALTIPSNPPRVLVFRTTVCDAYGVQREVSGEVKF